MVGLIRRFVLPCFTCVAVWAQTPAPRSGPPPAPASGAVIHIDVNLVQVDAVVTDSKGRHVSDLEPSAFEVLEDGKPQAITNFSYVSANLGGEEKPREHRAAPARLAKGEVPPPPPVLRPTEVRRTLALVVDDLGLSGEDVIRVRGAMRNFIDDQMRPGDLVAIIRTGAGMGALQQFTTEKRLLYAALERVKYGDSRVGVSSFAPLGGGAGGSREFNHFREDTMTEGTLGALRYVVNAMRGFPGRKSVVLFTENIRMIYQGSTDERVAAAVRLLADAANRASVVIHAIDPRGIPDYNLEADDNTTHMSGRRLRRVPEQRQQEVVHTEEGMFALSAETGGLFLHDTNDLAGALRKAADDSDGYYLLGYHPDASTFEDSNGHPKFHRITVRVKGAGLHVRSREGFFGEPGGNQPIEHTREAEIVHALQSPFSTGSIRPRLTALFSNSPEAGSLITAFIYLKPDELKWSTGPAGERTATIDVAAAAFDENGLALAPVDTTYHLQWKAQQYAEALQKGLVYGIHIPVPRPGPYVVRAAVRDAATEVCGAAQQYLEVPDLETGRLALSGIVLQDNEAQPAALSQQSAPGEDSTGGAARRTFRRGTVIVYGYEIMNAKTGSGQHPELETQTRVFRDGEPVLSGAKRPLDAAPGPSNPQRVTTGGRLALGTTMTPGEYVLQVVVTDKLAKSKFATATQSMDFEIEP